MTNKIVNCEFLKDNGGCKNPQVKVILGRLPRLCVLITANNNICEFKISRTRNGFKKKGDKKNGKI